MFTLTPSTLKIPSKQTHSEVTSPFTFTLSSASFPQDIYSSFLQLSSVIHLFSSPSSSSTHFSHMMHLLSALSCLCLLLCWSLDFLFSFSWSLTVFSVFHSSLFSSYSSLSAGFLTCRWPFPKRSFCKAAISIHRYLFGERSSVTLP